MSSFKLKQKIIRGRIINIAWPAVTELILVTVCQMVDMMMVGRLGAYAITAVGLTFQPKFLMLTLFLALNVGATALVARMKGSRQPEESRIVVRQILLLTLAFSLVVSVLGVFLARPFVRCMGGGPDVIDPGTEYFQIIMFGFIFSTIPLAISAVLRGIGNTKATLNLNLTANIVNVIFNYLLIYGKFGFPRLEVAGAAIATVLGTIVSSIMGLYMIFKGDEELRISLRDDFRPNFPMLKRIWKIGFPTALEQLALRFGLIIYIRIVAGLGTVVFATHQIALNILSMSFMNGQAFGMAATTLVGQSLGAGKVNRAIEYASKTRRLGSMVSTMLGVGFFFFGEALVSLYTNDPDIISNGGLVLKLVALVQPFQSSFLIISGALRGAGDAKWPAFSIMIGILIIRPLISVLCVFGFKWGLVGAWVALLADQLLRSIMIYFRFKSNKWTTIKV